MSSARKASTSTVKSVPVKLVALSAACYREVITSQYNSQKKALDQSLLYQVNFECSKFLGRMSTVDTRSWLLMVVCLAKCAQSSAQVAFLTISSAVTFCRLEVIPDSFLSKFWEVHLKKILVLCGPHTAAGGMYLTVSCLWEKKNAKVRQRERSWGRMAKKEKPGSVRCYSSEKFYVDRETGIMLVR